MSSTSPSPNTQRPADLDRLEDFYRELLAFEELTELDPHLDHALRLFVELAEAQLIYLELRGDASSQLFWRGYSAMTSAPSPPIRARVSHSIIARALDDGRAIETTSALSDPRFAELASVKQNQIGVVLCVPIGRYRTVGALYMQSERAPSRTDRVRLQLLAKRLIPIASHLIRGHSSSPPKLVDEIRDLQQRRVLEALERYDGNIARAARELGAGRKFVYAIMRRFSGVYPEDPPNEE